VTDPSPRELERRLEELAEDLEESAAGGPYNIALAVQVLSGEATESQREQWRQIPADARERAKELLPPGGGDS
jgi:hypothetical protein